MTILPPDETVSDGRIRLSALTPEARADAAPWLEGALAPEWTPADLDTALKTSASLLLSDRSGVPLGLAALRLDSPRPGEATFSFLAVEPARRFRGLGGEAGLAVERLLRQRRGIERFYAGVPEGRGLAVYFWLRLGYRPLNSAGSPDASLGLGPEPLPGIWMVRDTA